MTTAPPNGLPILKPPSLGDHLRALVGRWETIRYLTTSALKAGQRDKVLGHLWNILDPMMFMLVYYFVFGVLFGLAGGGRSIDFMLYIFSGVLTFTFFSASVNQAANCIRANRGLIHEISFPKGVFPVSVVLARLYDYAWGLVVLVAFLLIGGIWPTVHYLWVPLVIGLLVMLTLGSVFIVAYLGAYFADMANIVNVAMRLMFYTSPIFYFVRDLHRQVVENGVVHDVVRYKALFHNQTAYMLYMANPFSALLECLRDAMMWGRAPDPMLLGYGGVISALVLVVGFAVFVRGEGKFAKCI